MWRTVLKNIATFFTYKNILSLRDKNQATGELLNGKYFWTSDMLMIEEISRNTITKVVTQLLSDGDCRDLKRMK